jgi:hypothetical protein
VEPFRHNPTAVEDDDDTFEPSADTAWLAGLAPGRYRVELRTERLVIARRIEVEPGANTVTLRVHPEVAWRIAGPPPAGAPVIRLPVATR